MKRIMIINKKHITRFTYMLVIFMTLTSCNNIFVKAKALLVESDPTSTTPDDNSSTTPAFMLSAIAEGGYCFLRNDTENFCWGDGIGNQPVNFSANFKTAVQALKGKTITDIITSLSGGNSCAIDSDGIPYCWGDNSDGVIGDGTNDNALSPKAVDLTGVLSGKTAKTLALGASSSCMIASDDKAYCWGDNFYGQLGNGNNTSSTVPVAVSTAGVLSGKTIKSIDTSDDTTCVIASDDKAYCWGRGSFGVLANGGTAHSNVPVAITGGALGVKTVKALKVHEGTGCAIASDDKVYCWGWGGFGRLGNGAAANSSATVAVDFTGVLVGKTAKSLLLSGSHACIVASDDQVYCWGYGGDGELGHGALTNSSVPVAVNTAGVLSGKTIQKLVGMSSGLCALASDNKAYCWGYGQHGALGNGVTGASSSVPVAVDTSGALSGKTVSDIIGGDDNACVKTTDGHIYCWGEGFLGDKAPDTALETAFPTSPDMTGALSGLTINQLSLGKFSACAIASDNHVYCWGDGSSGELGNGQEDAVNYPVAILGTESSDEVILDDKFKIVLDGKVYIQRSNGELFSGALGSALSFQGDFGSSDIIEMKSSSGGSKFFCALTDNEKLYCWGSNSQGILGIGSTGGTYGTPQSIDMTGVLSGKSIKSFALGQKFGCVIASDNHVYCWGVNMNGPLGDGTTNNSSSPVAVDTSGVLSGINLSSIYIYEERACAISDAGKSYCWGVNNGVFGDGGFGGSNSPVATDMTGVLNNKVIKSLSLNENNACALTTDGLAFCWGDGSEGELGDASAPGPRGSLVPVAVDMSGALSGKTIKKISSNGYTYCAIASDDKAYCWGFGLDGSQGDNLQAESPSPVAVSTAGVLNGKTIVELNVSLSSVCVLDSDEKLYCWGDSSATGEVGTGTAALSPVPVNIAY